MNLFPLYLQAKQFHSRQHLFLQHDNLHPSSSKSLWLFDYESSRTGSDPSARCPPYGLPDEQPDAPYPDAPVLHPYTHTNTYLHTADTRRLYRDTSSALTCLVYLNSWLFCFRRHFVCSPFDCFKHKEFIFRLESTCINDSE